jgi:spore maturation protein CgeB
MFDPKEYYYKYGKEKTNQAFIQRIQKEQPDFVYLTTIYDEFYFETYVKAKQVSPHTKFINFFSDDEWRFDNYSKYFAPYVDFCITSYPKSYKKSKELGLKNFYLMLNTSCNADVCKKLDVEKKYDVSFIGQPTEERAEVLEYLIKKGVPVNIWGKGWNNLPNFESYKQNYRGVANDLPLITNQSKIMLAFLMDDTGSRIQIKGRMAEVAGCGTFQIATANKETQFILKEDVEAAYFHSPQDLVDKIDYYLKNESVREKIAERAYKKIQKKFTWQVVFGNFFKKEVKHPLKYEIEHKIPKFLEIEKHKNLEKSDIERVLNNLKEDYLVILDKKSTFSPSSEKLRDVAFITKPDVVVNDFVFATSLLGEIATVRIHHAKDLNDLKTLPIGAFAFSRKFVKKNIQFFVTTLSGKKSVVPLDNMPEKISYPLTYITSVKLQPLKDVVISGKYQITLLNYWFSKKYLRGMIFSILLMVKLALSGNLFIVSPMLKKIKKLNSLRF